MVFHLKVPAIRQVARRYRRAAMVCRLHLAVFHRGRAALRPHRQLRARG
jgi:hypothetical protein